MEKKIEERRWRRGDEGEVRGGEGRGERGVRGEGRGERGVRGGGRGE